MKPTPLSPKQGIIVQNDNASTIPPRSVVVVTSVVTEAATTTQEQTTIVHVNQWDGIRCGNFLVTGPVPIYSGKRGQAFADSSIYVAIDQTIPTPLVGEQWGPVPGQWTISRGFMGFYAQGYPAANGDPTKAMFLRGRGWAWGELGSSLAAGSWTLPTSATVIIYNPNPASSSTPKPLIQATPQTGSNQLTVYNYDPSLTGLVGYQCKIELGDCNGPSFYWVGCVAEST